MEAVWVILIFILSKERLSRPFISRDLWLFPTFSMSSHCNKYEVRLAPYLYRWIVETKTEAHTRDFSMIE